MKYLVLLNKLFILPLLPLALIPIISLLKRVGTGFLSLNVNKKNLHVSEIPKAAEGSSKFGHPDSNLPIPVPITIWMPS